MGQARQARKTCWGDVITANARQPKHQEQNAIRAQKHPSHPFPMMGQARQTRKTCWGSFITARASRAAWH
eukprot:1156607-Pelagomonas_calceolata.AAC.13